MTTAQVTGAKPLTVVRVAVASSAAPGVIATANAAGLTGAFVFAH
ncbi:MAG: hypothetical protein WDM94_09095 [Bauldia sp.]